MCKTRGNAGAAGLPRFQAAKPDCLIESNAVILRPVVGFVKCFLGQSLPMAQFGVFRRGCCVGGVPHHARA